MLGVLKRYLLLDIKEWNDHINQGNVAKSRTCVAVIPR